MSETTVLSEFDMWQRLADQLEPLVKANPDAAREWLTAVHDDVEDPEFFFLLVVSLGLDKHNNVQDVMRHPHYPGHGLICDRYWCETGARNRPCPAQRDGRCSIVAKPRGT
jgi:hypothetical protein